MMDQHPDRDTLYQAALLHDLGKFIERAKSAEWREHAEAYVRRGEASRNYAHRRYSAAFIHHYAERKAFLKRGAETLTLWHHRGDDSSKQDYEPIDRKGVLLKLLRIADDCASAERNAEDTLEPQKYYLARLRSPFNDIEMKRSASGESTIRASEAMYLNAEPLSIRRSALFPEAAHPAFDQNPYTGLVRRFLEEFEHIDTLDGLYALMEKYLHAVPAQTPVKFNNVERLAVPDINLFDHSRTVAAIALCLYDEYREGAWRGQDDRILSTDHETLPPPCLLVRGDVSGIQDFIFNIKSKGAAKQLKARSFYVQLLTRVVARFLLDRLDLRAANLLFDGGGNFYLLAPHCRVDKLQSLRDELERACLHEDLYLSLGWTPVSITDFKQGFTKKWREAFEACERRKQRRFQGLGLQVFDPFPPRNEDRLANGFKKLTVKLSRAQGLEITDQAQGIDVPSLLFDRLGYGVRLPEREDRKAVVFNDTDFAGKWAGFEFLVNRLPRWSSEAAAAWNENHPDEEEPAHAGGIVEFQRLAKQAQERTGTDKLGVLKLDVDNLGKLFTNGLPENARTIGRIASLSRTLKWFFEGYVNHLLDEGTFEWMDADGTTKKAAFGPELYVIFSGGDDFFAVGAWDAVFAFARCLRAEFGAFTGRHPGITFSAALLVVDPSYPVTQFARLAEERLDAAKHADDRKNRINVFGEVLTWNEFEAAAGIRDRLSELVKRHGTSRAVINKVRRSSTGYGRLQDLVTRRGRLPLERLWRLGYYLRDAVKKNSPRAVEENVKALIEEHEKRLLDVFTGKTDAYNPAFFAVGARWAELETRNKERSPQLAET
ncbi:MAG: type III-A CRISPR-associated protein Cas10/Csm1 [Rhodothermaceae bacterium]|nr:MAG: type III-A CRISPR-associated protein Cas10/Csm1 [Rhodothermaceae bacterium]